MPDSAEPQASPQPEEPGLRYSAFISYNSRDAAFARRLHKRLETYRVPERLAAKSPTVVRRTHRIKPIFRDNVELSASYDLTTAVRDAVAQSDCLIVICSPNSAGSTWVGREIELFRTLHGDSRILAALIDGTPQTAFPPTLHGRQAADAFEPLAADFRPGASGHKLAFLKLMSALIGVQLDELIQRDAQRQIRQVAVLAGSAVVSIAVVAGLTIATLRARADAESQRNRASGLGAFMATDLRKGLRSAGRLDLQMAADKAALDYYRGQDLSRLSPAALGQRARFLHAAGEDNTKHGDLKTARAQFEEARRTTAALLAAKPNDPQRIFDQAQSEYWVGFINWRNGDGAAAKADFQAYARLAEQLVAIDPADDRWRMERIYAAHNLGMLSLRQAGDPMLAERYFRASLGELGPIVRRKPDDADVLTELQTDLAWLADCQRLQGHLGDAATSREEQGRVLNAMLVKNPRNVEVKRYLLAHDLAVARIAAAEGKAELARSLLEAGHRRALALQAQDPDNKDFPKQARMFELFGARLWLDMANRGRAVPARIEEILGDCAPSGPGADNLEISDFCGVLQARLRRRQGDLAGETAALAPVRQHMAQQHDVLTARWGLNLTAEARPVQLAAGDTR